MTDEGPRILDLPGNGPEPVAVEALRVEIRLAPGRADTTFNLDEPLTMLHGQNGAGKSMLLEALASALTGRRGRTDVRLHVRMLKPWTEHLSWLDFDGTDFANALVRCLSPSLYGSGALGEMLVRQLERATTVTQDMSAVWAEVANDGLLSLEPVGQQDGRWMVRAVARTARDRPATLQHLEELREEYLRFLPSFQSGNQNPFDWAAMQPFLSEFDGAPDSAEDFPSAGDGLLEICRLGEVSADPLRPVVTSRDPRHEPDPRDFQDDAALLDRADELFSNLTGGSDMPRTRQALLSRNHAARRLAALCYDLAVAERAGPPVVLLDEPENGLHPLGQRAVAHGLSQVLSAAGACGVVATHSPHFLRAAATQRLHVVRGHDDTRVAAWPAKAQDVGAALGMSSAEAAMLHALFILVEGHHDQLLVEHFLGVELDALGARVVKADGGKSTPYAVKDRFILELTDAHLILAWDNVYQEQLEPVWTRAQQTAETDPQAARLTFERDFPIVTQEGHHVRSAAAHALGSGLADRVSFFGFSRQDILEYLPVEALLGPEGRGKSWDDLRREQGRQPDQAVSKDVLCKKYAVELTDERLLAAAQETELPDDFRRLLRVCRGVVKRPYL